MIKYQLYLNLYTARVYMRKMTVRHAKEAHARFVAATMAHSLQGVDASPMS